MSSSHCVSFIYLFICVCSLVLGNRKNIYIYPHILSYKKAGNRWSSYLQMQPWAFGTMTHNKQLYFSEELKKKSESKILYKTYIFRNSTYCLFLLLLALQVVMVGGCVQCAKLFWALEFWGLTFKEFRFFYSLYCLHDDIRNFG